MPLPHDRLQMARSRAGFINATDAARRFSWNENTYRSHENGERGLRSAVAKRYAAAFKVNLLWLLVGEGEISSSRHIPIIASIREEGIVHYSKKDSGKPLGVVALNFIPDDGAEAYYIDTTELGERYRLGDVVVCWPPDFEWVHTSVMSSIVEMERGFTWLQEVMYDENDKELVLFQAVPGHRKPLVNPAVKRIRPVRVLVPCGEYQDISGEHALSEALIARLENDDP